MLAEVLRHDGRLARRAGVVARVGEAGQALEQDLQLEEVLDLALERQPRQPRLARLRVLAPQPARVAQQVVVDVALLARRIESCDDHGSDITLPASRSTHKSVAAFA